MGTGRIPGSRARLVAGAAVLAATIAGAASAALPPIREGGTLRVDISGTRLETLDPAVNYDVAGAQILFATCAKLVNFADRPASAAALVPEVATDLPAVSDGGRTYTFTIRPGFRFETGEPVTAATFAHAINRDLSPALDSPAAQFLRDVVGAAAVGSGEAAAASGVVANGDTLTIMLTRPAPDFVARMAMSFFCAVPLDLPATPQGVTPIPAAGPYYVDSASPHVAVVLKRNPLYGGTRPHHLDEISFRLETEGHSSVLSILSGDADYEAGVLPHELLPQLASRYGVNRSQFLVHPDLELYYLALNTWRPLFS